MKGKRGLIMGVANDHSIAWGIAKTLAAQGAELAFTYQGEPFGRGPSRWRKASARTAAALRCRGHRLRRPVFDTLKEEWGSIDFLVHAIAFSDKSELKGKYADTTRENFSRTMVISCYSFTEVAKRRAADERRRLDPDADLWRLDAGDAELQRHGRAKAALESMVRYLAADYGEHEYPRQRDLRRAGAHACGRGHRRRAADVQLPEAQLAALPHRRYRAKSGSRRSTCCRIFRRA
jgi:enoyl-[acyl-carrier protein] reductase I